MTRRETRAERNARLEARNARAAAAERRTCTTNETCTALAHQQTCPQNGA